MWLSWEFVDVFCDCLDFDGDVSGIRGVLDLKNGS